MKITVNQEALDAALNLIGEIVEKRTTMPILGCVFLKADAKGLTLSATDLNVSARTTIPAVVEEPGEALLNAKKLQGMVRSLSGTIAIESEGAKLNYKIGSGKAKFRLPGLQVDLLPQWAGAEVTDEGVEIGIAEFVRAIKSIMFAIPDEDGRYIMDAFLISGGDFVAVDGFRLPIYWAEWATEIPDVLVPRRTALLLTTVLTGDGKMIIAQSDRGILFKFGSWEVYSLKKAGKEFPKYKTLIHSEDRIFMRAKFNTTLFVQHLERALICVDENKLVRLDFDKGSVKFRSSSRAAEEASDEMPIEGGEKMIVGFNCAALIEILNTMDGEVEFAMIDAGRAAMIRRGTDFVCLISPMRIPGVTEVEGVAA